MKADQMGNQHPFAPYAQHNPISTVLLHGGASKVETSLIYVHQVHNNNYAITIIHTDR